MRYNEFGSEKCPACGEAFPKSTLKMHIMIRASYERRKKGWGDKHIKVALLLKNKK